MCKQCTWDIFVFGVRFSFLGSVAPHCNVCLFLRGQLISYLVLLSPGHLLHNYSCNFCSLAKTEVLSNWYGKWTDLFVHLSVYTYYVILCEVLERRDTQFCPTQGTWLRVRKKCRRRYNPHCCVPCGCDARVPRQRDPADISDQRKSLRSPGRERWSKGEFHRWNSEVGREQSNPRAPDEREKTGSLPTRACAPVAASRTELS